MRKPVGKLARNERIKLSATYLNGVAIALMTAGVLAPLLGVIAAGNAVHPGPLYSVVVSCMFASGGLHLVARTLLRGLVE
ncbi:MAG TPA: amino acid transporter [Devosiaceae bacterium]|nr:amino acid transporter [Devosiaceae bacterium]